MKKKLLYLFLILPIFVNAQDDVILPNLDFEDTDILTIYNENNGALTKDTTTPFGTGNSAKWVKSGSAASYFETKTSEAVTVNRTETLLLSGWIKGPAGRKVKLVGIVDEDGAGTSIRYISSDFTLPDTEWHNYSTDIPVEYTDASNIDKLRLRVVFSDATCLDGDVFYVDDVKFSANIHVDNGIETQAYKSHTGDFWSSNTNATHAKETNASYVRSGKNAIKMVMATTGLGTAFLKTAYNRKKLVEATASNGISADQILPLVLYKATAWVKVDAGSPDAEVRAYIVPKINNTGSHDFNYNSPVYTSVSSTDGWVQVSSGWVNFSDETSIEEMSMRIQCRTNSATLYIDDVEIRWSSDISLSVSNHDLTQYNFSFGPNPAKNELRFSAEEFIDSVELYSLIGQKVFSKKVDSKQANVSVSHLNAGVYLAKVSVNGVVGTYKFIKE